MFRTFPSHSPFNSYFWTDIWGAAGCLLPPSMKCMRASVPPGCRPVTHCFINAWEHCWASSVNAACSCLTVWDVVQDEKWKHTLSTGWLLNAGGYTTPCLLQRHQMSHSSGTFFQFHCHLLSPLSSVWCSFDGESLTLYDVTLIQYNSHSFYKKQTCWYPNKQPNPIILPG